MSRARAIMARMKKATPSKHYDMYEMDEVVEGLSGHLSGKPNFERAINDASVIANQASSWVSGNVDKAMREDDTEHQFLEWPRDIAIAVGTLVAVIYWCNKRDAAKARKQARKAALMFKELAAEY